MRIVILGPFPPFRGGIAHFNIALFRALEKTHHVWAVNFTTQYPGFLFPGKTQFEENSIEQGVTFQRVLSSINPVTWLQTALLIRKYNPDVIITSFWMSFFAPALGSVLRWSLVKKKRWIRMTLFHNVYGHEQRVWDKPLLSYLLGVTDQAVTLSDSVARDLVSAGYKGYILKGFHPIYDIFGSKMKRAEAKKSLGYAAEENLVLFFGYIRDYKGLDLFIEASRIVTDHGVRCKYLAIGESYIDTKVYVELIKKTGMEKEFTLDIRFVPDTEITRYFSAADLVVCPYKSATQSGIVQIAYHFDRPVVVTRVGGLEQMVDDGKSGLLVEPNPDSIAQGIITYFTRLSSTEVEKYIHQIKTRFSWQYFVEKLETVWRNEK